MSAADKLTNLMEGATPGPWWVRHAPPQVGEDCFVAAKDVNGFPYDAVILGDDEYREESGGFNRKKSDCELITYLRNNAEAIRDLIVAAESYANSTPCSDPDCCDIAMSHEEKRRATLTALAKIKEQP